MSISVPVQEKPTQHRKLNFFRDLTGPAVEEIFGGLALLEENSAGRMILPRSRNGHVRPRMMLIEGYELGVNSQYVPDGYTSSFQPILDIAEEAPGLTEPRKSVINHLSIQPGATNKDPTNLKLYFDEDYAHYNGEERADLWHAIAASLKIKPSKLQWREYDPNVHVCKVEPGVPRKAVDLMANFVHKRLPAEVVLAPMINPRTIENAKRRIDEEQAVSN